MCIAVALPLAVPAEENRLAGIFPEWIKTERYMYCDNFVNDYTKSNRFSLLSFVKRLFHK